MPAAASPACRKALELWDAIEGSSPQDFWWDNMAAPVALLLREIGAGGPQYIARYDNYINSILDRYAPLRNGSRRQRSGQVRPSQLQLRKQAMLLVHVWMAVFTTRDAPFPSAHRVRNANLTGLQLSEIFKMSG